MDDPSLFGKRSDTAVTVRMLSGRTFQVAAPPDWRGRDLVDRLVRDNPDFGGPLQLRLFFGHQRVVADKLLIDVIGHDGRELELTLTLEGPDEAERQRVIEAVRQHPGKLRAYPRFCGDRQIAKIAVAQKGTLLQVLSPQLRDDDEIVQLAVENPAKLPAGRVDRHGDCVVAYASTRIRENRHMILLANTYDTRSRRYASCNIGCIFSMQLWLASFSAAAGDPSLTLEEWGVRVGSWLPPGMCCPFDTDPNSWAKRHPCLSAILLPIAVLGIILLTIVILTIFSFVKPATACMFCLARCQRKWAISRLSQAPKRRTETTAPEA